MYRVVQHLEGFFSRIDENHWLLPSPICSESSHCYLRTSIQAIQIAQVFTVRQRKTRERGIPFYRRNLISFVCISRAAAPFLPATDADLQRFYKEYFVDSDSEDDGILFKRRMFVSRPVHLINLGPDRKSRADEADRTIY